MKSRSSHAMVFNSADRNLYVIGGQRSEYLNDFFAINVDTLTVNFLSTKMNNNIGSAPALNLVGILFFFYREVLNTQKHMLHFI